ncbi:efflux RND transporter periplasmic adaptor subunit [Salinispira pacifica]
METKRHIVSARRRAAVLPLLALLAGALLVASCTRPGGQSAQASGGQNGAQASADGGRTGGAPGAPGQKPAAPTVFPVSVTEAVTGDLNNYIAVTGGVQAANQVDVYADTSGQLVKRNVSLGQYVRQNEVVAEVDPSRPGQNFVPSPVRAPIAGTITALPADIGSRITQGVPVVQISTLGQLEIHTDIAERYIGLVRLGERAFVSLEPYPDERFAARVSELSPVVDPQTRTMGVTLQLDRPDQRVKPGMFAEIKIITQQRTGLVKVPSDAILIRGDRKFVFVVDQSGSVVQRDVSVGIEIDGKAEVTAGLSAGEKVVVKGQTLLANGAAVKVIEEVPPLPAEDKIL